MKSFNTTASENMVRSRRELHQAQEEAEQVDCNDFDAVREARLIVRAYAQVHEIWKSACVGADEIERTREARNALED